MGVACAKESAEGRIMISAKHNAWGIDLTATDGRLPTTMDKNGRGGCMYQCKLLTVLSMVHILQIK